MEHEHKEGHEKHEGHQRDAVHCQGGEDGDRQDTPNALVIREDQDNSHSGRERHPAQKLDEPAATSATTSAVGQGVLLRLQRYRSVIIVGHIGKGKLRACI